MYIYIFSEPPYPYGGHTYDYGQDYNGDYYDNDYQDDYDYDYDYGNYWIAHDGVCIL